MDLIVLPIGVVRFDGAFYRCALGRSGTSAVKREGDGATSVRVGTAIFGERPPYKPAA